MEDPKPPPSPPPTTTENAAVKNFRSLVVQYLMSSAPNMFFQKDQIEQRIQELVPDCPTPRHPTYYWMIEDAITRLNEEGELSSAESISNFILAKHNDLLPWSHATLLKHHLKKLCESGFLVVNDDGLYFLGKETTHPEPVPEPEPMSVSDPDPSLDYGYESDSTSSSGESFSPIKEREMIKRLKNKTLRKKNRRKGKNVHCSRQSRKRDSVVQIELKQESVVDEERIDEPLVYIRKRKRGRPRKSVTSGCNSNQIPLRVQRKNVNVAVAEEVHMAQDKVVAGKQNQQNKDQEFRPQIEVYTVDSDDTANIANMEQSDEDSEDVDLIIDKVHEEFQAEDDTQSFTIEDTVLRSRTEEQHRVQIDKHLVDDRSHVEPITMVPDIVPKEQNRELSMGRTGSLQGDAFTEESGKGMNISEANGIQNMIEATELEDENQNEPDKTIDLVNSNCQAEPSKIAMDIAVEEQDRQGSIEKTDPLQNDALMGEKRMDTPHDVNDQSLDDQACLMDGVEVQERESDVIEVENHFKDACIILEKRDKQAITEQNEPEAQEFEVRMERTESLQKHVHVDDGDNQSERSTLVINVAPEETEHKVSMERNECLQKDMEIEEPGVYVTETKECDKECDTDEQSAGSPSCLTNRVECQERDFDVIEEKSHLKDGCELSEEQDEQAITEQNQPEEQECEVIMEMTDSSQNYAHILETGKYKNETEAIPVCDHKSEELKFEKANQNESAEIDECDEEIECNFNEQAVEDQAWHDDELQKQENEESRFCRETEEQSRWKDASELVAEQDQQVITEQYQSDKGEKELKSLDETGNEKFPSQNSQKDGVSEGESQQSEEQKQELEMRDEYENRGILISPGPGTPQDSGISLETVLKVGPTVPIFGVGMGLKCIGEAFGGKFVTDNVPEEQKRELGMGRTGSLQINALTEESGKGMNISEANGIQNMIEATKRKDDNQNEPNGTIDLVNSNFQAEPGKIPMDIALEEQELQDSTEKTESLQNDAGMGEKIMNTPHDVNDQSLDDQACLMDGVEFQERESDVIELENHLKDACKILEKCDKQATNEQDVPEAHEFEVSMEQEYKESRKTEEQNRWKDACELVTELDQQAITEQYQPDKGNQELNILDELCKQGRETGNEQKDAVNKGESQQSEEQKQEPEMHDEYQNLDQVRPPLEKENIYSSREQEKNEGVNQHLNELNQDAAKKGEGKGITELMLEFDKYCVSEKMELESHCGEKTNTLEHRPDTSSAKKSFKLKALNVVHQVEKRQLRPRLNKTRPIESEAKGSIIIPSPEKLSETNPHKNLRVTKRLKHGVRRSLRLQQSRSGN